MGLVYGYNHEATADAYWGERPPRNLSRSDVLALNLFDGGHGDQNISKNPILLGLGATLRLALNQFTRRFKVTIQDISPGAPVDTELNITSLFTQVFDRMYELRGRIGYGSLNPGGRSALQWSTTVTLKLTITSYAVTLQTVSEMVMYVSDGSDIRSCAEPCLLDLTMLQCLRENFIHFWKDKIDPLRVNDGYPTPTNDLYFFFEQSDALVQIAPCICDCFNYYSLVMVGVKYFVVGTCEEASGRTYPEAAGCNPWQEDDLPDLAGAPCNLPSGWPSSAC